MEAARYGLFQSFSPVAQGVREREVVIWREGNDMSEGELDEVNCMNCISQSIQAKNIRQ